MKVETNVQHIDKSNLKEPCEVVNKQKLLVCVYLWGFDKISVVKYLKLCAVHIHVSLLH